MRFPRQAKIFRGQLSAAPLAGVLLLLLIFIRLGSLLYIPGVLVSLKNPAATVSIAPDGRIHFGTNFFTERQTNRLREALIKSPAGPPFDMRPDPAAPQQVVAGVSNVVRSIYNPAAVISIAPDGRFHFGSNVYTEHQTNLLREALRNSAEGPPFYLRADPSAPPKAAAHAADVVNSIFLVHPPPGPANLIGTDNPTVMVRINYLGEYIYDNHIVKERDLKAGFREQLEAAARESKELTLTVAADSQVNWNAVVRLTQWARETGIKDTVFAEWSDAPSASTATPSP